MLKDIGDFLDLSLENFWQAYGNLCCPVKAVINKALFFLPIDKMDSKDKHQTQPFHDLVELFSLKMNFSLSKESDHKDLSYQVC